MYWILIEILIPPFVYSNMASLLPFLPNNIKVVGVITEPLLYRMSIRLLT